MAFDGEYTQDDLARWGRLWRAADLSWMLDPHQLDIYDHYRDWDARMRDPVLAAGTTGMLDVFVLDCARRVGKTWLCCLIKCEDCLARPGSRHTYATAYAKDIAEIIIPLMEEICATAPADCKPKYQGSRQGLAEGYYFPNGSVLRLVGIDVHPRSLRGRASDGFVISEAAFVKGLKNTVGAVILPQFQRRPWAKLLLESSAPEDPEHDFETFVADAKMRDAYVFRTLWDNTSLTAAEKRRHYDQSAAIDPDLAAREYDGLRVRNRQKVVVPEFDAAVHVRDADRPAFAAALAAMDPGFRDLFALLWGYWDVELAALVVERDYAERNASTATIAEVIKRTERELYGDAAELREPFDTQNIVDVFGRDQPTVTRQKFGLKPPSGMCFWDGKGFRANPCFRVSDTEPRLIGDLTIEHGISVMNTLKDDKEAALFSLRNGFRNGKIIVHSRCRKLIAHLNSARWNEQRTDYERTDAMGHYDLLDALVYMWRMAQPLRAENPVPPEHYDGHRKQVQHSIPSQRPRAALPAGSKGSTRDKLAAALGGRRASWR